MTAKILTRRSFLAGCAVGAALLPLSARGDYAALAPSPPWNPGNLYPSYRDEKTGVPVYNLTPGGDENSKIYQTHPMWTRNMEHLVFHSKRDGADMSLWMLALKSGEARPIPAVNGSTGTMTWSNNDFYYVADRKLHVLDLGKAFLGEASPRVIGPLPEACLKIDRTVTVDADLSTFYFGGVIREEERWAVFAMDTRSGEVRPLRRRTSAWDISRPTLSPRVWSCSARNPAATPQRILAHRRRPANTRAVVQRNV